MPQIMHPNACDGKAFCQLRPDRFHPFAPTLGGTDNGGWMDITMRLRRGVTTYRRELKGRTNEQHRGRSSRVPRRPALTRAAHERQ